MKKQPKDYRADHCLGVARRCYELAKEEGYNEYTCRKLFLIGYLHDVGYEFSNENSEHNKIGFDMIYNLTGYKCDAILSHGKLDCDFSDLETRILNTADMTVNSFGNKCTVYERLMDIKRRYGRESEVYKESLEIAKKLKLVEEDFGKERENLKLNSNCVNVKIKANILSDDKMKEIGFTENTPGRLYFCRRLHIKDCPRFEISFSVTIYRDGSDIRIDVLDEDFCQPYDYQHMLEENPKFSVALKVKEEVEKWMKYLEDNGVLTGHIYGEYI